VGRATTALAAARRLADELNTFVTDLGQTVQLAQMLREHPRAQSTSAFRGTVDDLRRLLADPRAGMAAPFM